MTQPPFGALPIQALGQETSPVEPNPSNFAATTEVAALSVITSYFDERINLVRVSRHFGGDILGEATEAQKKKFDETATKKRAAILEMPSQEEGINLGRVHGYRERLGISRKEMRFLRPEEFAQALAIEGSDDQDDLDGFYSPTLDLIVVKRNPELESLNGSEYTESVAIHEIVHSDTEPPVFEVLEKTIGRLVSKKTVVSVKRARSGFREKVEARVEGLMIEEGLADYERGQYVEQELGRPGGFVSPTGKDFDRTGTIPIPGKYWSLDRGDDGSVSRSWGGKSSLSAATLEILISQDPGLYTTLRANRRTPEGRRSVIDRMNAIKPGLYNLLNDASIDGTNGVTIAFEVFSQIYDSFVYNRSSETTAN
jgi:hypothetical protein